jgi:nitrate reductase beta subunit
MSELEQTKNTIIQNIQRLCAHCVNGQAHDCPIRKISEQVSLIRGIPLIVNDEFRGVIFR